MLGGINFGGTLIVRLPIEGTWPNDPNMIRWLGTNRGTLFVYPYNHCRDDNRYRTKNEDSEDQNGMVKEPQEWGDHRVRSFGARP